MALIQIIANGITLDYVKETLTIREDNTALFGDLKMQYANHPFLILENERTKTALGPNVLQSDLKKKVHEVIVLIQGERFKGVLTILSYLPNYRKCDLKYGSDLVPLFTKKIRDLMPVVSVTNSPHPIPYTEETFGDFSNTQQAFADFVAEANSKPWPESQMAFPTMRHLNRFGVDLDEEDDWYLYQNFVNNINADGALLQNELEVISATNKNTKNKNVASPQVYLMEVLRLIFLNSGYTIDGGFYKSQFFRKVLLFSKETNMVSYEVPFPTTTVDLLNAVWERENGLPYKSPFIKYNTKTASFTAVEEGDYRIDFSIDTSNFSNSQQAWVEVKHSASGFIRAIELQNGIETTDSVSVTISSEDVNTEIRIKYIAREKQAPDNLGVIYYKDNPEKTMHFMHPTIELSRFVPDWTVSAFINNLKKWVNLDVVVDDHSKIIYFNFLNDFIKTQTAPPIKEDVLISKFDSTPYDGFVVKYENEEDAAVYFSKAGIVDSATSYPSVFENKFKLMPSLSYTTDLSEEAFDRDGVGLILFKNHYGVPYTSKDVSSNTLNFNGVGGLFDLYWKDTLAARLNSASVVVESVITATELRKLKAARQLFMNHQKYIIISIRYSETVNSNFKTRIELETLNF